MGGGPSEARAISSREWSGENGDVGSSPPSPAAAPALSSSPFSVQVPASLPFAIEAPPGNPSFDKKCTRFPVLVYARAAFYHLTHDELHDLRRRRGCGRKGSQAGPTARLYTLHAAGRQLKRDMADVAGSSGYLLVIHGEAPSRGGSSPGCRCG